MEILYAAHCRNCRKRDHQPCYQAHAATVVRGSSSCHLATVCKLSAGQFSHGSRRTTQFAQATKSILCVFKLESSSSARMS